MAAAVVSTEDTILEAARKVFMQKGFAATRMCDIAQMAGINQALLHYYFRSKDRLFGVIFEQQFQKFYSSVEGILRSDMPFFDKLRAMIATEIQKNMAAPYLPMFILNEMHSNPKYLTCDSASTRHANLFQLFSELTQAEYKAGRIRKVCPRQLLLSIMGLSTFPFLARPMARHSMDIDDDTFQKLMLDRVDYASDMVIRSLEV